MTGRPDPKVYLQEGGNPWSDTVNDEVLGQTIVSAAKKGEELIQSWIASGRVKPDAVFAQVILDPTRPRDNDYSVQARILAVVLYGDPERARKCLPNAVGKADAADRHGGHYTNGELVANWSFCLGNGDFAWGDNAMFGPSISAGSGLSVDQDKELAGLVLTLVMTEVHELRVDWLAEQRNSGSQSWFNLANTPDAEYKLDLDTRYWTEVSVPTF